MLLRYVTGCCLSALVLAASTAHAGVAPVRIPNLDVRLAAMECGPGYYREASGACIDFLDKNRTCPSGYFSVPFPNGNGYRCVPVAWLKAHGWLSDLF
jgi:hypothetical protein